MIPRCSSSSTFIPAPWQEVVSSMSRSLTRTRKITVACKLYNLNADYSEAKARLENAVSTTVFLTTSPERTHEHRWLFNYVWNRSPPIQQALGKVVLGHSNAYAARSDSHPDGYIRTRYMDTSGPKSPVLRSCSDVGEHADLFASVLDIGILNWRDPRESKNCNIGA